MDELTRCPKCKTRTLHREGQELICSECKGRFPAPATAGANPVSHMSRAEIKKRHEYYETNRQAIMADFHAIGHTATAKKWKIPSGSLSILVHRWQKDGLNPGTPQLPPFPPWNDNWQPQVQVMWLEVYKQLLMCR